MNVLRGGARFAFGYGACPNLDDRAKMMELLEPERIGVMAGPRELSPGL